MKKDVSKEWSKKLQYPERLKPIELKCRCGKPAIFSFKPYGKLYGLCREHNTERLRKLAAVRNAEAEKARLKPKVSRKISDRKAKNRRSLRTCSAWYWKGYRH